MAKRAGFDNIELHLVRVLHVLITERSVSRAALKLQSTQPVVSAQLKRLRALTGDPLLVRAGNGMTPTQTALALAQPAVQLLHEAERLFSPLVARVQRLAPHATLELHSLSAEFDYRRSLATGEVDLVIGNWLEPPGELHLGRLLSDEVVCLVAEDHPVVRLGPRAWNERKYLDCQHVAPMPLHPGARGVIDEHLAAQGLARRIAVRSSHFSLIPLMVAQSLLVLTTGRLFCSRYIESLPVSIVRCPVPFPPMNYYQLWHDLTHASASMRWLREQVKDVAAALSSHGAPRRVASRRAG